MKAENFILVPRAVPGIIIAAKTPLRDGREEFERELRLEHEQRVDLGNGLSAYAYKEGIGRGFYTWEHNVPEPSWGKKCFAISGGVVVFEFESPVSSVSFSYANVRTAGFLAHYYYKEKDGGRSETILLPPTGESGSPPKDVSLSSERGFEYVAFGGYEPIDPLFIDNLKWEK